ncbi:hypothetical protein [Mycobacteroides abscessus]|uniref:hypothetical protein n=1 Tax=Mycobacteroides abscessus TaxID=36809 RepID=UPI000928D773|nr:hypothetical protein [Mycobacteroides abscessus]MBN7311810.1 hypothetical protein [Mycobacteroides abscessus subsp. abscessus]SHZ79920.1 Uncharacterised protein [Mycobacteroides abscessus subsp. abscessus]
MTSKPSPFDTAVTTLHGLIVAARAERPNTSGDPYLDAITLWTAVVPQVREVLNGLDIHESTLGEVEYLFREVVTALLADDELEHKIRVALDPPEVWIF